MKRKYKAVLTVLLSTTILGSWAAAEQLGYIPSVALLLMSECSCESITGRMWMRSDDGVLRTYDNAESYCDLLEHEGYSDWRMPDKRELECLVDKDEDMPPPYITPPLFVRSDEAYWTSAGTGVNYRMGVDFVDGSTNAYAMTKKLYTRCVRMSK